MKLRFSLALLPLLSACATIVEGTSQNVSVATDPPGATCSLDRDGQRVGVISPTPGTLRVDKSKKDLIISCTKDGLSPGQSTHTPRFVGTTFGNLLVGGVIGAVVDASSGANYTYPEEVKMTLQPVQPVLVGPKPIVLQPPAPGTPAS